MKRLFWILMLCPLLMMAQHRQQPDAAEIKLKLKKLGFLGSVLYMAAHPDDENTRVITYMANEKLATTAYLSLTRGDGGQNLIGPEIGNLLGLIRTQELLAARRIDGGQQFFTRAIDFGFSKSADEAFSVWGKEAVLSDAVKVFRMYQPDVIITRFPPDERAGHGHHTASAVLAGEAFEVAADPKRFPEQVAKFGTWQPMRLYTNTGRWWNQSITEKTPGVLSINVGAYNPLYGKSYAEIAALSSSQHKSQGWGRAGERGYIAEYFEYMKGKKADDDFFDGINTTWTRVKGGEKVLPLVEKAITSFDGENPSALVPQLFEIRAAIEALPAGVWRDRKLGEVQTLIQDCLGLYLQASASHYYGAPGEYFRANVEVANRGSLPLRLLRVKADQLQWDTLYKADVAAHKNVTMRSRVRVSPGAKSTEPYWLAEKNSTGLFAVANEDLIGAPENNPAVLYLFDFELNGKSFTLSTPLVYKWVDRVKGELWRPFEIVPPVLVNPQEQVLIFNSAQPKTLGLRLRSVLDRPVKGQVSLKLPAGWRSEPAQIDFEIRNKDEEMGHSFSVFPPAQASSGQITAQVMVDGQSYDESLVTIDYDHIPVQTLLPQATTSVVRLDLKTAGNSIGYIRGAGDEIPAALRNMGYTVWEMKDEEITADNLSKLDAVVLGIRAYNTNERIRNVGSDLMNYVQSGGTLVVQYNTSMDLSKGRYTPYPLKISRDRVTEEDAEVRITKPQHRVLNWPNKITADDFKGWVQERGLYFPNEWDPQYETVLSMNDTGELAKEGSLLIANYGKGKFVYTGLSFFRELPQGVVGAYKLFANIVSLGQPIPSSSDKGKTKLK